MARNAILELLQAASNAAAGNVSGPVDLLAEGMRRLGIPVGNEPLAGSAWMKRQGLMRDVQNPYINAAGETLGMVAPIGVMAKAPQIAAGVNQAIVNAQAPRVPGKASSQRGAIVYHGSDRKFDALNADFANHGVGGIWATDSPAYAEWLASKKVGKGGETYIYKLDASPKNPFIYDIMEEGKKVADEIGAPAPANALEAQELLSGGYGWDHVVSDLLHEAKTKGHDALFLRNFNDNFGPPSQTTNAFVFPSGGNPILRILERNGQPLP